jgi:hypothetical protein
MVSGINGSSASSIIYELMRDKKIAASADDESKKSEETKQKYDTVTVSDAARSYSPPAPPPDFSGMSDDELTSWLRDAESKYGVTLGEDGSKSVDDLTDEDLQSIREALSAGPGGKAGGPQGPPPAGGPPPDFSGMSDDELVSWLRDAESEYGVTLGEDGSKSADELTDEDLQSIRETLSAGPGGRAGGPQGPPPAGGPGGGPAAESEDDESLADYIAELRERLTREYAENQKTSVSYAGNPAVQAAIAGYESD